MLQEEGGLFQPDRGEKRGKKELVKPNSQHIGRRLGDTGGRLRDQFPHLIISRRKAAHASRYL